MTFLSTLQRSPSLLPLLLALPLLAACQESQQLGDDGGTSDAAPEVDCTGACMDKAESCSKLEDGNADAPDSGAAEDCAGICAKSPTTAQIECLRSSNCGDLETAFAAKGTVCGIGESDGG
jgi:hypothetical protein